MIDADCLPYRFGHTVVRVFPELVTIAVPYGTSHDDFCDASMFVERYTHGADATVIEDDEQGLELHTYPNTENLISGSGPYSLPGPDPRLGHWDEPSRRPVHDDTGSIQLPLPGHSAADPRFPSFQGETFSIFSRAEWFVQDMAVRASAALAAGILAIPH